MSAAGSRAYESSYVRHCSIGSWSVVVLVGMLHCDLYCPSPWTNIGRAEEESRVAPEPTKPAAVILLLCRDGVFKVLGISPTPQSSRVRRAIRATEENLALIVVDDSAKGNGQQ
ncbi:hypothetical protein CDEST_14852 [Colletotrichum destructivum]|uniref:Uncharacterized protein n=1 Tax=Colletotrichum destructivum TaxID=34406 RepID=A0AAX4J386_9PEZI|nr:hypothetical protein CDEST_14852 [Colletotrichum destructivum]